MHEDVLRAAGRRAINVLSKMRCAEFGDRSGYLYRIVTASQPDIIQTGREFVRRFPNSKHVPDVYYTLAQGYEGIGEREEARAVYARLARTFPRIEAGKRASARLERWSITLTTDVQASRIWTDTGINLPRGRVTFLASGLWTVYSGVWSLVGAEGHPQSDVIPMSSRNSWPLPAARNGALVGRVGGAPPVPYWRPADCDDRKIREILSCMQ